MIETPRSFLLALALLTASSASAQSVIATRLDDPAAVYLAPPGAPTAPGAGFGARGDGAADDSAALQAAIDKAAAPNGGIVFIASGRYRITRTIYVWRGVRIFGYG